MAVCIIEELFCFKALAISPESLQLLLTEREKYRVRNTLGELTVESVVLGNRDTFVNEALVERLQKVLQVLVLALKRVALIGTLLAFFDSLLNHSF